MIQVFSRSTIWIARLAALVTALCLVAIPIASPAQVFVGFNIGTAPPPLPYYAQPALTTPGDLWQPGYWAWGSAGYYWVPGTWVAPPAPNMYWTPGYWGYNNGGYGWNNGYWGPTVGFYGGIDYGFGYNGAGYVGGAWNNGTFNYNTAVTNVNNRIVHNVYVNRRVVVAHPFRGTRYSYNGRGGIRAHPTAAELAAARERHIAPTRAQVEHARIAAQDRNLYASVNHGHPATAAVARPIASTRSLPHYRPVAGTRMQHAAAPTHVTHTAPSHAYRAPYRAPHRAFAPSAPHRAYAAPAAHSAPMHAAPMHAAPAPAGRTNGNEDRRPPAGARRH